MLGFGNFYIYPRDTAMHGAIEFRTPWGWVVIQPPVVSYGQRQRWFAYLSPDATPTAATLHIGPGYRRVL